MAKQWKDLVAKMSPESRARAEENAAKIRASLEVPEGCVHAVWKYGLDLGSNDIVMPADARLLCVQALDNDIYVWAQVYKNAMPKTRHIFVLATGDIHGSAATGGYVGTVFCRGLMGTFVWHVFDGGEAIVEKDDR